jgi:ribulose-bisphosphate carboxylase large chain
MTADHHLEMVARGEFILKTFGPNADHVAFLVDGYVAGPAAVTTARRRLPKQYLHYHRAGHSAATSPQAKRGYTALVLSKMARLQGASGIHIGTMGCGKMEGEAGDRATAYMINEDSADGPFYHQEWLGMNSTTPIISGGVNALRMPGFFENLVHSNPIMTEGGGAIGHIDGGAAGARSLRAGGAVLEGQRRSDRVRQRPSRVRAFESFPHDADALYPGWRDRLGMAAA